MWRSWSAWTESMALATPTSTATRVPALAARSSPPFGEYTERHLFRVKYDGSSKAPERLTGAAGFHGGLALSHGRTCFVDQYSSAEEPAIAALATLPPTGVGVDDMPPIIEKQLHSARAADARVESLGSVLTPPQFVSFPSSDGKVTLQAALYVPDPKVHGTGPFPTVVSCYGGPHVQFVQNSWGYTSADLRAQFLRAQGFLVAKVDNRGSDRRGLAFEGAIRGAMGGLEVDDQAAVVAYAAAQGLADPERVGIMGWSYGGYLSAMCLARAPKVFRCAVAGAPVTSWDGYDTHYTERYMGGTPQSVPEAYEKSSVMSHVDGIEGALMLVHGLMDENVHFRHTARLTQALVESQKRYELLCFPKERHSPRGAQGPHLHGAASLRLSTAVAQGLSHPGDETCESTPTINMWSSGRWGQRPRLLSASFCAYSYSPVEDTVIPPVVRSVRSSYSFVL